MAVLRIWGRPLERKNNTDRQSLTKQEARSLMKQKRALLSEKEREEKDRIIFERLFAEDIWEGLDWFYPFVSYGTEVDTIAVIRHVLEGRTTWEAPRVAVPRVRGRDMDFYEITSMEDLEPGYREILEPGASCPRVTANKGLMLLPGLAFERRTPGRVWRRIL